MKDMLLDYFNHNHWANRACIETVAVAGALPPKTYRLISHILQAQRIWLGRIQPEKGENLPHPWDELSTEEYLLWNDRNLEKAKSYLQSAAAELDLNSPLTYANSRGDKFSNSVLEIFNQILTHSAYHRGQVNQLLREAGIDPPMVDYIFYKRG
jgi:uncharacterized damage-inducible protein DinB